MTKSNYDKDIYKMYEEQLNRAKQFEKKFRYIKLDYDVLNSNYEKLEKKYEQLLNNINEQIEKEADKKTENLKNKVKTQDEKLIKAYAEIERLKSKLEEKDYDNDKLERSINKDSTNSGITTSKEISPKHTKTGANTYNHRVKSTVKTGGRFGHKGSTLTKEKLLEKIKEKDIKIKTITHYINGKESEKDVVKYKIGMNVELYVEEHIFKHTEKSEEKLPKEYYSDVTYNEDLKSIVVTLGNYYCLSYNKVNEILSDFSNGIINISEGTIDNIYEEFSNKSLDTIDNIVNNLLNGPYQHTDETTTSESGKQSYYRGYANPLNVLYKYHGHKGDKPIEEDNILPQFYGTIISDHEVGIFKYGTNNQDCIYHIGRYCIEEKQNIYETCWQMKLYDFLLRCDRTRKIAKLYGLKMFEASDLKLLEQEYDDILKMGKKENENIKSKYWKIEANKLLKRLIKYKKSILFYIHDFTVPSDNNFMERCLRMIKGKTKVSGGFRSKKGGERFGNIMSIIKTSKLRNLNPLDSIKQIYQGKELFT